MFDLFKSYVLVLRGTDIEGKLETVYDRERMQFLSETFAYLDGPQALFITNQKATDPFIDYIL